MSSAVERSKPTGEDRILAVMLQLKDKYTHDTAVIVRTLKANGIDLFAPGGLAELRAHLVNDDHQDPRTGRRFRYAPRSANRILAAAKARMRAVMDSDIGMTVAERYQLGKELDSVKGVTCSTVPTHRKMLTPAEVQAIIDGCDPGLRLIVRFIASTGVRISEALKIKLADLHKMRGTVDIDIVGKGRGGMATGGGKARTVHARRELVEEIVRHFKGKSYLFEHGGLDETGEHIGKPYGRVFISQKIGKVARRTIGRDHVSAHMLRHAYASRYVNEHPEKLDTLRQLLGHASISTTQVYLHNPPTPQDGIAISY